MEESKKFISKIYIFQARDDICCCESLLHFSVFILRKLTFLQDHTTLGSVENCINSIDYFKHFLQARVAGYHTLAIFNLILLDCKLKRILVK